VLVAGRASAARFQSEEITMTKSPSTARDGAPKQVRRTQRPAAEVSVSPPQIKPKVSTKADLLVVLLRRPAGITAAQMSEATGWQIHSVRGFIAGAVKKKLGLAVATEKVDGQTVYRIVDGAPA